MTPAQKFPENTKSMNIRGTLGILTAAAGVVILGAGRAEDALTWGQLIVGGATTASGFLMALSGKKDGPLIKQHKENGLCVKSEAQLATDAFNAEWGANRLRSEAPFQGV